MKIARKFSIWIISIVLAAGAVTVYLYYTVELRAESAKLDLIGRLTGRVIEESLITYMQRRDIPGLSEKLEDIKKSSGSISRIWVLNNDGVVKVGTDKQMIGRAFSLHDAGCRECHEEGRQGFFVSDGRDYRWAAPINNKQECHACHLASARNNGVLVIDFSIEEFLKHRREELLDGVVIIVSLMIVIGVVMFGLSRSLVTRRLDRIGAAMKNFREGDLSARAPLEGSDEITALETGFNEMAQAIATRELEKDALVHTVNEQLRFLQVLIDTIPMPIFYKDVNGVYLGYNSAFEEFLGLKREKLIGKTVYDVAPKELADKYYQKDKELFDVPGIQTYEFAVRHADGSLHDVIFNKATYADARGNVTGLIGVMQDITVRKRMEDDLRQTNETLQAVIHASPLAVVFFDANGSIGMWNNAAERIFGWSEEEVLGRFNPLVLEEKKHEFMELLRRVLGGDSLMGVELNWQRKDGALIDVSVSSAPLRNAKNVIVSMMSVISDITDRKQLEQKLVQSESHLRAIIDTEPECVKVVAADGTLLEINPAGLAMIEADSFEQIAGLSICPLVASEYRPAFEALSEKTFRGETGTLEFEIIGLKGTRRWLETHSAPMRNAQGEIFALLGVTRDITERKRIELALRESEDKFRQVVTSATDAILVFDAETRQFVEVNRAAEEIYGYSREEWLSMRQDSIPVDKEAADAHIREIVSSKKPLIVPLRYHRKKDGTIFPVEISSSVFMVNGRQLVCGIIHDITERKKAEEVIQRNYDTQTVINWVLHVSLEDLPLKVILKQALDLILSIPWLSLESKGSIFLVEGDPDKLVMKVQRGLSDSRQEACAIVPFGKCMCGRAAARAEVQFSNALNERHDVHYDGIAPHGHYCVPIMHGKTVFGVINMYLKEGHPRDEKELVFLNAMASALAGIIQRKHAEEEREKLIGDLRNALDIISRSHKEWRDTFDSITDMISIVSKDFSILKANRAFSAFYRLTPQDVLNKKCYELIHDSDSPILNCPHRTTMTEKKPSGLEMYDQRTGRTLSIFTFPYNSPEGETIGSIHIMRDITDEKEKEMRLITSERLAALGQMASGIAHEINNPLASIAGCSEGLLSRVRQGQYDTALFESYLSIIQEEVFRCKSITTAMLSFVRKTTYEKKEINLAEMLDKTIEIIGFQGRLKHIEVVRKYHEPRPTILGNEGELRQVILAVVTNALDAMLETGTLSVETDAREDGVAIRISDTGKGIPPEIINRIFDPFFTTKSETGGTGLGLSIARKIAGNHNGKIEVTSTSGKGTTFTIILPKS